MEMIPWEEGCWGSGDPGVGTCPPSCLPKVNLEMSIFPPLPPFLPSFPLRGEQGS